MAFLISMHFDHVLVMFEEDFYKFLFQIPSMMKVVSNWIFRINLNPYLDAKTQKSSKFIRFGFVVKGLIVEKLLKYETHNYVIDELRC